MNERQRSFLRTSGIGCMLPGLLCLNLFFGWLILPLVLWIVLELLLVSVLFYSTFSIAHRIRNISRERKEIIDVEASRDDS